MPLYDLASNWAYMLCAALAWNFKAWFAVTMRRHRDRHDYIRMEFRRFFPSVIPIPAAILRRARGIPAILTVARAPPLVEQAEGQSGHHGNDGVGVQIADTPTLLACT